MTRKLFLAVAIHGLAGTTSAGEWELTLLAGWTAPTYEQSFAYDPGITITPPFPGLQIRQRGEFGLSARGDFAFGGGVAFFFTDVIGIEGRVDTVDLTIDTLAPQFAASLELPSPLPPVSAELDLGAGSIDVERLFPLSLNLKARTRGRTRLSASGGISYLPRLQLVGTQTVGLGVTAFGALARLDIATISIRADALPDEEGEGRLGFNAGAGVVFDVSESVAVTGEVRAFRFQKQTFVWRRTGGTATPLEEVLLERLEQNLEPLEIEPVFYQASGGVVFRF